MIVCYDNDLSVTRKLKYAETSKKKKRCFRQTIARFSEPNTHNLPTSVADSVATPTRASIHCWVVQVFCDNVFPIFVYPARRQSTLLHSFPATSTPWRYLGFAVASNLKICPFEHHSAPEPTRLLYMRRRDVNVLICCHVVGTFSVNKTVRRNSEIRKKILICRQCNSTGV